MTPRFLLLVFCLLGVSVVFATNHYGHSRTIFLHNREIDTHTAEPHRNFESDDFGLFYVTFKPMMTSRPADIQTFQEDYGIIFDDYLPVSTYFLYAPHKLVGKIADDSRVVWVGSVPYIDKIPFNISLPTNSNRFIVHFAKCVDCPTYTEEVNMLAQRMQAVFDPAAFTWGEVSESSHLVVLTINDEAKQEKILTWILRKGSQRIRFLEVGPINRPSGTWATHITTDGSYSCGNSSSKTCTYNIAVTPLSGAGQIIALVDTGLDTNNCFFEDPSGAVPFGQIIKTFRKVVSYITTLGDSIDNDGHGTFVSGLALGVAGGSASSSQVSANAMFNGLSSGAKLVVMDVLKDGSNTLNIPLATIQNDLLNVIYNVDESSRIGLFPWGSTITQAGSKSYYSLQDQSFDDFVFTKKDYVAVFAVGNEGDLGASRIQSASSAKNTIGVGGSLNAHESFEFSPYIQNIAQLGQDQYVKYCTIGDVSAYNDPVFCNQMGRPYPCPTFQTVLCPPTGNFDGSTDSCCLYSYFKPLCCPSVIYSFWQASTLLYSEDTVYPMTSRGPTYDNRIKPDILAPAQRLYSAFYDNTATGPYCGTWTDNPSAGQAATVSEGTSGAAGLVAGASALVREWLKGGYWPTGNPSDSAAFPFPEPIKASLVKALLINSAEPLSLINHNRNAYWETIGSDLYSPLQGFGRINLQNILTTVDNPTAPVYIVSDIPIPYSNYTDTRCIRIDDGATFLRITAVWTDPAASVNAGVALVNNIDLVLVRDDGFEFRSNGKATFDSVNNVEDIYLINPPPGSYAIKLHGTYITTASTQLVDLVIRGDLKCSGFRCLEAASVCSSPLRICPLDCAQRSGSDFGSCVNGNCICSAPYYGVDCTLTPCPNNCNGNGVCNGETGTCICDDFWKGTDCSTRDDTGTPAGCNTVVITQDCSNPGVDEGIVIGVTIGAFFLGAIIFFLFGAWLAMHLMLRRKKKMIAKYRQMKAHEGGRGGLNPQIAPDDDE